MQCFSSPRSANGVKYRHYHRRTTPFHAVNTYFYKPSVPIAPISIPQLKLKNLVVESQLRNPISLSVPLKRYRESGPRLKPVLCGNSSNSLTAKKSWFETVGEAICAAFPVWVALGCLLGLVKPQWTVIGITLTMLGMGMTLTFDDLRGALAMPKELFSGFILQYSVMPLSAFLLSKLLNLPSHFAAGLILVGCCPGGTGSNIVTYIARGNVALSVLITAAGTLSAVVMTPFLTSKFAGQYVAVDAVGLFMSTLQVVLPVFAGAFLNQYFQSFVKVVSPVTPPIAVSTVAALCGNAISQSSSAILMSCRHTVLPFWAKAFLNQHFQRFLEVVYPVMPHIVGLAVAALWGHAIEQSYSAILTSGRQIVLAVALLHASGFFFGYVLSRMLGLDVSSSRTISIEVGMQNSALGVVLATQHFGNPLTAVPCAVSSVCHSVFGSALAGIWRCSIPTSTKSSLPAPYNANDGKPEAGYPGNPYPVAYGVNPSNPMHAAPSDAQSYPQYGPGPAMLMMHKDMQDPDKLHSC